MRINMIGAVPCCPIVPHLWRQSRLPSFMLDVNWGRCMHMHESCHDDQVIKQRRESAWRWETCTTQNKVSKASRAASLCLSNVSTRGLVQTKTSTIVKMLAERTEAPIHPLACIDVTKQFCEGTDWLMIKNETITYVPGLKKLLYKTDKVMKEYLGLQCTVHPNSQSAELWTTISEATARNKWGGRNRIKLKLLYKSFFDCSCLEGNLNIEPLLKMCPVSWLIGVILTRPIWFLLLAICSFCHELSLKKHQ